MHSLALSQNEEDVLEEIIEIRLESIQDNNDETINNDEYLIEIWKHYYKNPIPLDLKCADKLKELNLLSEIQIRQIIEHISAYGPLNAIEELQQISALDHRSIRIIQPFVKGSQGDFTHRNTIDRSHHHRLRSRYARQIQLNEGYRGERAYQSTQPA